MKKPLSSAASVYTNSENAIAASQKGYLGPDDHFDEARLPSLANLSAAVSRLPRSGFSRQGQDRAAPEAMQTSAMLTNPNQCHVMDEGVVSGD